MADDKRKILLRADRADVARWDRAAEIAGLSRTAFIVATLNAAVGSASSVPRAAREARRAAVSRPAPSSGAERCLHPVTRRLGNLCGLCGAEVKGGR